MPPPRNTKIQSVMTKSMLQVSIKLKSACELAPGVVVKDSCGFDGSRILLLRVGKRPIRDTPDN